MSFHNDFVWGAAAASYQIEGSWNQDGKGLSVWDMLCRQPGRIWNGDTGDTACEHYLRYREDVAMMRSIGLKAYRFSISWPRVIPQGQGPTNALGLGFYDRLVDELLAHEIEPWVTLFHWDYPYELFLRGGWLNRDSPKWFADYAAVIVDALSDRVSHWITLNEPQCFIGLGHLVGEQAPGLRLGLSEVLLAGHNCLLAHGLAVQTIRSRARKPPTVGWAPVVCPSYPETDSAEDIAAARTATFSVDAGNCWSSAWWGDPVVLGTYPEQGLKAYGKAVPKFPSQDLEIIKQPLDFYGCNTYHGTMVRAGAQGQPEFPSMPTGYPHTLYLWKVTPKSLYWGPKFLYERYKLPIVVTENGMSSGDWVGLDGRVHDEARIDFLNRYLLALHQAAQDDIPIRGYFHWSIMDNFEWAEGYKHRFGIVHVDFATQTRTLKDSAYWYREVIRTNGERLFT